MATADEIKIRIIAKDEASKVFKKTEKSMVDMKGAAKAVTAAFLAIGSSQVIRGFVQTSAKFESMRKSLITVTGSAGKANAAFGLILKSAQEMPFSVQEITASFIKMRSLGIEPTEDVLKSFANTASATGKSFDQFAEAVADAMTGEFERLKEFGIKASQEGDKVTFTFQGMTTTIGKNSAEIVKYLQSIGEVQFAGAAVDQMNTLSGAFSNMGDAIDQVVIAFGNLEGIKQVVNAISDGLRDLAKSIRLMGDARSIQSIEEVIEAIQITGAELKVAQAEAAKFKNIVDETDLEGGVFAQTDNVTRLKKRLEELNKQLEKLKNETNLGVGGSQAEQQVKSFYDGITTGIDNYIASVNKLDEVAKKATENGLKTIEDGLVDIVMGTKSVSAAFKDMARSIIADLVRIQIRRSIMGALEGAGGGAGFGNLFSNVLPQSWQTSTINTPDGATVYNPNLSSMEGGGYTGSGGRVGGVDGRGGFPAILHPNETVIDHTKGQGGGQIVQNINVNTGVSQTVRAEIANLMPQIIRAAQSATADARMRGGSYSSAMGA
jgi:polyhydroxyalkanoate synthesis regulator phasin